MVYQYEDERFTEKHFSLSPLAFFIKLLLFPLSLMPLVEFLIYHLRPQLPH